MAGAAKLLRPLRRRLDATDGSRRARPLFVEIDPMGIVTVWPRRCLKESMSAIDIYIYGTQIRKEKLKEEKRKQEGRPYVAARRR